MDAPFFHHARGVDFSPHGIVYPTSPVGQSFTREYAPAYNWLSDQCGFAPLFLAVGADSAAWDMTGFGEEGHDRGEACFSWYEPPEALVYCDYVEWHRVLNAIDETRRSLRPLDELTPRRVMRPRRSGREWIARAVGGEVQACTPHLDLRTADIVTCSDRASAEALLARGFSRERLRIAHYRPRTLPGSLAA